MNNLRLYSLILNLKNRLENEDSIGLDYSAKQISQAIGKINEINALLDRRNKQR